MSLIVDTEVMQLDIDEAWNDSVTTDKMIFHNNSKDPKLPLKTLQEKWYPTRSQPAQSYH